MEVICLEDKAFYALVETVIKRIEQKQSKPQEKWINGETAMKMLNITSKSTLQKYRDEGKIRFSQPQKRIILYDTESIHNFLNNNARNAF